MIQQIDVRDLADRLAKGEAIRLLDVRQPWEHDIVALPGSQLIPLDQLSHRADEIARTDTPLVVYCHHGIRSQSAAALLQHLGFANVSSLRGGVDAWSLLVDASLPRY